MENTYNDLFVRCRNLPTPREQQISVSCHCHLVFQCIATLDNAQTEHSLTSVLSFVCSVCVNSHQRSCVSSQHLFWVELFIIGKNRMRLCFDLPKCLQSLPPQLSAAVRRQGRAETKVNGTSLDSGPLDEILRYSTPL